MTRFARHAAILCLALTGPTLALAQTAPPPPPPPGATAGHWGHGPMDHGAMDHGPWAHEAGHMKAIHDILGIKPDQEAAFQAYVSALHPDHPGMGREGMGEPPRPDPAAMAAMTTPERLDLMAKMMDAHEAKMHEHFQRMATATKAFYAALTPEQKRIMDALPELAGSMGPHWGHGDRGHGDMDHMPGGHGPMGAPPPPPTGAGE